MKLLYYIFGRSNRSKMQRISYNSCVVCLFKLQSYVQAISKNVFVGFNLESIIYRNGKWQYDCYYYNYCFSKSFQVLKHSLVNNRGWCAEAVSMPKGKYRLPLFIRWLSLEFFSSHCRPQATSGSYRLNVVCIIRIFFKLHIPTHIFSQIHMWMWVCVRANKVHCLTVYNRLSEMGIKRGLHALKVCRGLHMLLLVVLEVRFRKVHVENEIFERIWAKRK